MSLILPVLCSIVLYPRCCDESGCAVDLSWMTSRVVDMIVLWTNFEVARVSAEGSAGDMQHGRFGRGLRAIGVTSIRSGCEMVFFFS